jgi:5-methylcytosine-specific restriction endonuclease McrA
MKVCLRCGSIVNNDCPECGESVFKVCPLCGAEVLFLNSHGVCEKCWELIEKHRLSKDKVLWYRDGKSCRYCGKRISLNSMTKDHIIPKSKGGRNTYDNLICCCETCNKIKGRRDVWKTGMNILWVPGNFFREN